MTFNDPPRYVLYLDIDGPLHPWGCVSIDYDGKPLMDRGFRWAPVLLKCLQDLPDVAVVVHSSWRLQWNETELRSFLPPALEQKVWGITPEDVVSRYGSIQAHSARHGVNRYVILDDEPCAFPPDLSELIVCHSLRGLSQRAVANRLRRALFALLL